MVSIIVQQDANIYSLLYLCKLLYILHPSSGAHITVITASGTGQTVFATFRYGGAAETAVRAARWCNYSYMCS
jgi:hypothetical protein